MRESRGFTLIELMIVVAIIGILASVAIPSFLRFIKQTKASEVPISLNALKDGAISWYVEEHTDTVGNPFQRHFPSRKSPVEVSPVDTSSQNPSAFPCVDASISNGAQFTKNTNRWNSYPWLALRFSITKAHYYTYEYHQTGSNQSSSFTISAIGDLDCDTDYAKFSMIGFVQSSSGEVETTNIFVANPLE